MVQISPTIQCPHCGERVTRETTEHRCPGSPFRRCPGCGRLYFDDAYEEPAITLLGKKPKLNYAKILYFVVCTVGAVFYLRAWLSGENPNVRVPALVFSAIALFFLGVLVHELAGFSKKRQRYETDCARMEGRGEPLTAELTASLERLGDKAYLDALESYGVDVPEFFRDRAKEKPDAE